MDKFIRHYYDMKNLQVFQLEHHHGLSFCLNLHLGLEKNICSSRLQPYVIWFYQKHLYNHFKMEETALFPILGRNSPTITQALSEHKRLRKLFECLNEIEHCDTDAGQCLSLIAKELDHHIKYEERIVFPEITAIATAEHINYLEEIHGDVLDADDWEDKFWL